MDGDDPLRKGSPTCGWPCRPLLGQSTNTGHIRRVGPFKEFARAVRVAVSMPFPTAPPEPPFGTHPTHCSFRLQKSLRDNTANPCLTRKRRVALHLSQPPAISSQVRLAFPSSAISGPSIPSPCYLALICSSALSGDTNRQHWPCVCLFEARTYEQTARIGSGEAFSRKTEASPRKIETFSRKGETPSRKCETFSRKSETFLQASERYPTRLQASSSNFKASVGFWNVSRDCTKLQDY